MTDLENIRKLEKEIGQKLKQIKLEEVFHLINGYVLDENEKVIGLNLYNFKLSKIPGSVRELKNLTHLFFGVYGARQDNPGLSAII